ncbi:MAG: hypothetical protein V4610_13860 [Pseudomonadota bacterium]|jgi:hypothetical protein
MIRPTSIIQFERFYLAAIGVDAVNTILSWSDQQERALLHHQMFGDLTLPLTTVAGFGLALLLWFLVARQGSAIAKWALAIFVGLALAWTLYAIPTGHYSIGLSGLLGLFSTVLQAYAVAMLFRGDARPWFGAKTGAGA